MHLGSFEICNDLSFEDPPHLVAVVSNGTVTCDDPSDLATQLEPYMKVLDYPEARASLLDLLVKHRRALALHGEPLGVTDKVKHRIVLKPNANPSYVPSYRLPHSQRVVVQNMIEGMLDDGVIQESCSAWNSPLFLVPKRDGTYRPVVDFRAVNK